MFWHVAGACAVIGAAIAPGLNITEAPAPEYHDPSARTYDTCWSETHTDNDGTWDELVCGDAQLRPVGAQDVPESVIRDNIM